MVNSSPQTPTLLSIHLNSQQWIDGMTSDCIQMIYLPMAIFP
jgi:hypothetical protein